MKKFLKDKFLGRVLAMGLVGCMTGVAFAEQCLPELRVLLTGGAALVCPLVLAVYGDDGSIIECDYGDCHVILAD